MKSEGGERTLSSIVSKLFYEKASFCHPQVPTEFMPMGYSPDDICAKLSSQGCRVRSLPPLRIE